MISEEPFDRKARGSSRPPLSERSLRLIDEPDNRDAARLLAPLVRELRRSAVSIGAVRCDAMLAALESDPGVIRRVAQARAQEAPGAGGPCAQGGRGRR